MKQIYALLTFVLVLPFTVPAQTIVDNVTASGIIHEASKKAPAWEKQEDRINGRISRSNLEKMKSTTEAIAAFLQDSALSIEQYSPVWHGEYFPGNNNSPLQRFAMSCSFIAHNENKGDLLIMANDMSPMLQSVSLNGHEYFSLKSASSTNTDCPHFELAPEGKNIRLKFWVVAANNANLPYAPVTRKDYLQDAIAGLTSIKNERSDRVKEQNPIRTTAVQEAEKKAYIDHINNTYSGTEREVRMRMFLKNYQSDEDFQKEKIKEYCGGLDSSLHLMDSLFHLPAAELNRPAMILGDVADFQGFADGIPEANMLIKPNGSFINPALSTDKPQFFVVCWRYNPADEQAAELDKQLTAQLKCSELRTFLGK